MRDQAPSRVSPLWLYLLISILTTTSFAALTLAGGGQESTSQPQPVESANATLPSSDPSCFDGVDLPLTVTSIVFMVLGLQLTIWSGWILVQRHKR
jgi:hypothetical protein